jgi:hypothetical protein
LHMVIIQRPGNRNNHCGTSYFNGSKTAGMMSSSAYLLLLVGSATLNLVSRDVGMSFTSDKLAHTSIASERPPEDGRRDSGLK